MSTPAEDARAAADRRAGEYETGGETTDGPDRPHGSASDASAAREGDARGGSDDGSSGGIGGKVQQVAAKADEVHQRTPWLAIPIAVVKKFGDDRGGNHAALIAYYGFFSLFPLLLAFTTVLGFLVEGNEELRQSLTDTVLANFPVIGDQIEVKSLEGSVAALVIGLVGAIWAGMGVILSVESALDDIADVPRRERPNFLKGRLRALLALMAFGLGIAMTAGLGAIGGAGGSFGFVLRGLALLGTFALNVALFAAAYRFLTVANPTWRQVLPGAVMAAVGWMILLALGSWLVANQIEGASETYGTFAFVIGLLAWIGLSAQLFLFGGELNVVLARGLWPRALKPPPLTSADREVLAAQAKEAEARPTQDVDVAFEPPDSPSPERHE